MNLQTRVKRLEDREAEDEVLVDLRETGINASLSGRELRSLLDEIDGADCGIGPSKSRHKSEAEVPPQANDVRFN